MPPKRKRQSTSKSRGESSLVSKSPKRPKFDLINTTKEAKIRIGSDYQAVIPDLVVLSVNEYVLLAKEKYGHTQELAMSVLYRNRYDLENAIKELPSVKPLPADEWTPDDNAVFESAYERFGKNFTSIKYMMPHKPIGSLVKHYYLWKRNKHTNGVIGLKDLRRQLGSVGPHHDKTADKPIALVDKYYYMWKRKTLKKEKNCVVGKQSQGFKSAGLDPES